MAIAKIEYVCSVCGETTLPQIVGKSDKQIKYADDCRTRYLCEHIEGIKRALKSYNPEKGCWANTALANAVRKAMPGERDADLLTVMSGNPAFFYLLETEARRLIDGAMVLDNSLQYEKKRKKVEEEYQALKAQKQ